MAKLKQEDLEAIERLVKEAVAGAVSEAFEAERPKEVATVAQIVGKTWRLMEEQEVAEVNKAHSKMLETAAMIEEIAARGELNISMLGDEANKRAYALAVTMAEQEVVRTESLLSEIREYIAEAKWLAVSGGGTSKKSNLRLLASDWEVCVKQLLTHEKAIAERLEAERQRLADLKLA